MDLVLVVILLLLLLGGGGGLWWGFGVGWGIGPIGLIILVIIAAMNLATDLPCGKAALCTLT